MTGDAGEKAGARPPLVWVAELFSVLSAASFMASIWMHQTIFQSWGLSYFQVATPSDVLLGGISTVALALGMTPWLIGGFLVAWVLHRLSAWTRPIRPWLDWPIGVASALTAYAILDNGIDASLDAARSALLAYGAASTWLLLRLRLRFASPRFRTVSLGTLSFGLALTLAYACGQRITFGFGGNPIFAQDMFGAYDLRARCEDERIVWIGQRALVVRCWGRVVDAGKAEAKETYVVLLNPGSLWLGNASHLRSYKQGRDAYDAQHPVEGRKPISADQTGE